MFSVLARVQQVTVKSYCVKREIVGAVVDGDLLMMHPESGEYFAVTGVGLRVWELLSSPIRLDDIVSVLCDEFEVDSSTCNQDATAFLDALLELGLVSEV